MEQPSTAITAITDSTENLSENIPAEEPFCFYCGKRIQNEEPVFSQGADANLTGQNFHKGCALLHFGDPPIPKDDTTPAISQQANDKGFEAQIISFGKLEGDGCDYFNPSLVERPDGIWMLTRRSEPLQGFRFGQNNVWAFMMDGTGKIPKMAKKLNWPNAASMQHFEDPRGFWHDRMNQTVVGACTFIW